MMIDSLEFKKIQSIKRVKKKQKVYNFNVPGYENYVANGFIVHNCENEEISQSESHEAYCLHSNVELVKMAKEKDCPSVCMTYNEPTIAFEYLIELANLCHENDLKFIIKTNAYINRKPWKEVCKVTDAINIDYKGVGCHFEDITQCRYDYEKGCFQWKMFDAFDNDVHVELSIPVFPDLKLEERYFLPLQEVFNTYRKDTPVHLLKVNPAHLMINERVTSDEDIEKARKDLSHIFKDIYI